MKTETPRIYADLQDRLVTARFVPGAKIKPALLQAEYGCSANTIRDVLLRLSKVGLVEFEAQRGFRARTCTPETRADVARFRILLEQEGAAASIERGDFRWEADLSAAHHRLAHIEGHIAQVGEVEPFLSLWSDAEWAFHDLLVSACGSPILKETYRNVYLQFRQQMVTEGPDFGESYFNAVIREHQAILDAALARDEAACRQAIHDHLKRNL